MLKKKQMMEMWKLGRAAHDIYPCGLERETDMTHSHKPGQVKGEL